MHNFDKTYWERHWAPADAQQSLPVNPYLPVETADLEVGTALDAGCGTGTEALWLAAQGWDVTGADIAHPALLTAQNRAAAAGLSDQIEWVEVDVARWQPGRTWDLVVTNYAHPDSGQLDFYRHIASWVAPGGTLLIVGHLHRSDHSHDHPDAATVTLPAIMDTFSDPPWQISAGYNNTRSMLVGDRTVELHDVVVRVQRIS